MKPVVYIDVLFIINLIINYILLFTTSKLSKAETNIGRVLIGASIGALYSAIMFFPQIKMLYTVSAKFVVSLIIISVTFNIRKLKNFLKVLCIFYLISFTFGGVTFALLYFTDIGLTIGSIVSNGIFYFNLPWKTLIISTFVSYLVIHFSWKIYKNNSRCDYKKVYVFFNDKNISLNALIDTGNMLKDPLSQMPVIVAEYDYIKDLFPSDIASIYKYENGGSLEKVIENIENSPLNTKFRLIPFTSLGVKNGMLLGFKPDNVLVDNSNITDIIVGIYDHTLSNNHEYNALINPEAIRGAY